MVDQETGIVERPPAGPRYVGYVVIRIVRWEDFQHYRDRNPPWIKCYRNLLDDPEYRTLSHGARCLLHDLWLLASEGTDGCVHMDSGTLAWRLRESESDIAGRLSEISTQMNGKSSKWIELDALASKALATRKQDAIPETETETEKRQRPKRRDTSPQLTAMIVAVLTHYRDTHPRRRPFLPDGSPEQGASRVVARALEWGYSVADLNRAITANANDSWHRERKKHELGYVLRTSEKISEWIDRASNDEEEAGLYGGITWMAGGDAGGDSSPDSGDAEDERLLGASGGGCVEGGSDLGGAQRPGSHADDGGEVLEDVP